MRQQQRRAVQVSKEMSRLLRHAPPPGAMDSQGWVPLSVLAQHMRSKPSLEEIRSVVADNDKQRFVLDEQHQPPRIRAAQGHSITLADPQLSPVTHAAAVPAGVHATSQAAWQEIQACGELRRMSRTHIHFATSRALMRANSWVQVLLLLDLQGALASGHAFWLSANGVLLCEGPLPVQFVREVSAAELQRPWDVQ